MEEEGEVQEKRQIGGVKKGRSESRKEEEGVCCRYGCGLLPGSLSPAPVPPCAAEHHIYTSDIVAPVSAFH